MKIFRYIALILLAGAGSLPAQTNTAVSANTTTNVNTNAVTQILALVTTNPPPPKPKLPSETVIQADGAADFDQAGRGLRVIYRDNVRVDSPSLKLRCEWLAANLSQTTGHPTNIVAETNVVIDAIDEQGHKMHATGDKAVYRYDVADGLTNETVTLTGQATADYKQITIQGDIINLDLAHHTMNVPTSPKTVIRGSFAEGPLVTNAPVAQTNFSSVETNLPLSTNQADIPK